MRKLQIWLMMVLLCAAAGCSPRDFLTRRLAADLIAGADAFKANQEFWLRTGTVSSKDYFSPEYMVLQRRGWITGANAPCAATGAPSGVPRNRTAAPSDCWDVVLTPLGVETFRDLIPSDARTAQSFSVPVARRELVKVTGISKNGNVADADFLWKWVPLNEVGAALYADGVEYNATVGFKHYDDGWRLVEGSSAPKTDQGLDDALKNAQPAQ
jgi:hypothetical protein